MPNSVYIVGGSRQYVNMFLKRGWEVTTIIEEADLVQFTGGEDVTPALYGESPHRTTGNNPRRDEYEKQVYDYCIQMGTPMTGICRGGQFLNVMNGGKMWQDVDNHGRYHDADVPGYVGKVYVSSTHHQMMIPNPSAEHIVLMTASQSTKKESMGPSYVVTNYVRKDVNGDDVESIYYPETRSLCYQPHPEFASNGCQDVYFHFINNYLMANLDKPSVKKAIEDNGVQKTHISTIFSTNPPF